MSDGCPFCRIVAGESETHVVLDEPDVVGFLDARPVFPGHTLVVPRVHHETLPDLPPELVEPYFANARLLSGAIPEAMGAQGSFVAINNVVSQSVPHLHVHVVPRVRKDGLRGFFWPRTRYDSEDDAAAIATRISRALADQRASSP